MTKIIRSVFKNKYLLYESFLISFLCFFVLFISIIRFDQLFSPGFYYDTVTTQYEWGKNAFEMGLFGFYQNYTDFFDYMPGNLVFLYLLYAISSLFGGSSFTFVILLKTLAWATDIFLCAILYIFAKKYLKSSAKASILATLMYIFPSSWLVSNVWGQNDTLAILFGFLTVYFAFRFRQEEGFENLEERRKSEISKLVSKIKPNRKSEIKTNLNQIASDQTVPQKFIKPFYKNWVFLACLSFVFGMWFKMQIILLIPMIVLLLWKKFRWTEIFKFIMLFVFFAISFLVINSVVKIDNYEKGLLAFFGILTVIIPLIALGTIKKFLKTKIWNFLLAIFISILSIGGLFSFFGIQKVTKALFAPAMRADTVSNGASTFWSIIELQETKIVFSSFRISFEISASTVGLIIYTICFICLIFAILYRQALIPDLKVKDLRVALKIENLETIGLKTFKIFLKNLFNFLYQLPYLFNKIYWSWFSTTFLIFYTCGLYFLFFTKMHSRYLHFSILTSFFLLVFQKPLWKNIYFWVGFILIHLGYSLNQVLVYQEQNKEPICVHKLSSGSNFNLWITSGVLMIVGFSLIVKSCWKYFGRDDNMKNTLTGNGYTKKSPFQETVV